MSKVAEARDGAIGLAAEQSRQVLMLAAFISFMKDESDSI